MSDARDEFYIKSMTQRTKDIDDAYDRIRDLEARNAELEKQRDKLCGIDADIVKRALTAEARVKVLEEALRFTSEQHCPENPETALGRTLRMLIDHARQALQAVAREEGDT